MSPDRTPAQHVAGPSPKPYTRSAASTATAPKEPVQSTARPEIAPLELTFAHHASFPTHAQYKHIEDTYIRSLTPRRQCKALISQAMFDRIWDVLQRPDTSAETPQFRFWARKMFCLRPVHQTGLARDIPGEFAPEQVVMLHDGLLVAVQEQIYELLCYCHGTTHHGGRDKTCALLRTYYTWVPKEIVSQFIKACPTCIMKKCGQPEVLTGQHLQPFLQPQMVPAHGPGDAADHLALSALRDFVRHLAAQDGLEGGTREDASPSAVLSAGELATPLPGRSPPLTMDVPRATNLPPSTPVSVGPQSLPMFREVSLYQGLPNGWQYHYSDHATAHAAFLQRKHDPAQQDARAQAQAQARAHDKRPRVPSIAPLISARLGGVEGPAGEEEDDDSPCRFTLPPLVQKPDAALSPSLEQSTVSRPVSPDTHAPQIDPALLALSACPTHAVLPSLPPPPASPHLAAPAIRRTAAPRALGLGALSSQQAIQAFLAFRDAEGGAGLSPDSPGAGVWPCALPMTAASSVSAEESALPTPVDELRVQGGGGGEEGFGKGKEVPQMGGEMGLVAGVEGLLCGGGGGRC